MIQHKQQEFSQTTQKKSKRQQHEEVRWQVTKQPPSAQILSFLHFKYRLESHQPSHLHNPTYYSLSNFASTKYLNYSHTFLNIWEIQLEEHKPLFITVYSSLLIEFQKDGRMEKPKLGIQSKINKEIMAPLLILINKEDQKKISIIVSKSQI